MEYLHFLEINNSKFYGFIFKVKSVEEFDGILSKIKSENKRATHFVYCYKITNNNKIFFKKNESIEPKGVATKAMINLIDKNNLNNIAFIIVRYFGGSKLGVGKLTNSYSKVANESYKKFVNNKCV